MVNQIFETRIPWFMGQSNIVIIGIVMYFDIYLKPYVIVFHLYRCPCMKKIQVNHPLRPTAIYRLFILSVMPCCPVSISHSISLIIILWGSFLVSVPPYDEALFWSKNPNNPVLASKNQPRHLFRSCINPFHFLTSRIDFKFLKLFLARFHFVTNWIQYKICKISNSLHLLRVFPWC